MRNRNYFVLCVLAIIWGSSFILMKKALLFYTPLEVAAIRMVVAGLFLSPLVISYRKILNKNNLPFLLYVGILGNGIPAVLFTLAETQISSAVAGSLNALTPVFALIFGLILFKVPWNLYKSIGVIVGFMGAIIIVVAGEELNFGNKLYSLYIIIATACYGLSTNIIKSKLQHTPPLAIAAFSLFAVAIPYAIILLSSDTISRTLGSRSDLLIPLGSVLALAIVGTSIALILFNQLIQKTSAVFGASVTYLIPLVALALGIMDGEKIAPFHLIGLVLILLGITLISRARRLG